MLAIATHAWFLLKEFLRAPFDAMMGRERRVYSVSVNVNAPKTLTWNVASAHSLRLEGLPPMVIDTAPDTSRPGVYTGHLTIGNHTLAMAYRILEERPGEAMSLEVLKEESAPECCPGSDYICAFAVAGDETHSVITSTYALTHTRFLSRLLLPLAAVQNIRRLKYNAELRAGVNRDNGGEQIRNAAVTGLLTFASFFALFGAQDALMLLGVILVHELGHVFAMRWAGIPVKGIYFIPFFGAVAVGADQSRSEGERGFVALMGPGCSLATTALLWVMAAQGRSETLHQLAFMSAIVNGFNLLPIMPLDGGQILQALMSRFGEQAARAVNVAGLIAGLMLAFILKSIALFALVMLVSSVVTGRKSKFSVELRALTAQQAALLSLAYAAAFLFYAFAVAGLAPASPETLPATEFSNR